ncbi:hypothetical protein SAMN05660657_05656 [Geodermatophilus amargosae]|uniref:Uncharacterized protein n=1 Tax=Geodermatophilus amargosae TaxID=1296565 RepID=A0A1I7DE14_9ACTN|nr:hypothetical protein [Geodermatophilus amargosae]SFU09836.1 hypothetical protein SAMN05660657_05656 [Geodermatophilus amargosae]
MEAARGRHEAASGALARARDLEERAGTADLAVLLPLVEAFAAPCRGDLEQAAAVLIDRIATDGGRLPQGHYESVGPSAQ